MKPMRGLAIGTIIVAGVGTHPLADTVAAAPRELQFSDVQLSTGVRLHYAVQGDPSGEALILLHGYTDSWYSFSQLLPLIPTAYRAYALDQRGHGDSDRPEAGYAMHDMARDVIAFMDEMGLDRATLVGHSMGSFVAQQVALAAPERTHRLVLMASGTTPRSFPGVSSFAQTVNALPDPVPVDFVREFQMSTVYQSPPDQFMHEVVRISAALPARVWRGALIGMLATDPPAELGELGIPTLILWGAHDEVFLRSEQEALVALLPAARFETYADTGHAPHWERPQTVAQDLLRFLTSGNTRTP